MTLGFGNAMQKALQLTRERRVSEAAAAIQAALTGRQSPEAVDRPKQMAPQVLLGAEACGQSAKSARPIRPLGDAVDALRRTKAVSFGLEALKGRRSQSDPELPAGAQFLSRSFACAAGRRGYRLYVPRNRGSGGRPLLIMLHGCKQDPVDFAIGTGMNALAEPHGMLVAYPGQSASANPSSCWNWFNPADQGYGVGEPAILAGLTRDIIAQFDIDPGRVFIAGLSAGGAMAAVMAAVYPNLYAAAGIHSGLPYRSANDVVSAFAAMRGEAQDCGVRTEIRTIVFHGGADTIVHPSNGKRIANASSLLAGGVRSIENGVAEGGRTYTKTTTWSPDGRPTVEEWLIHGGGHAWFGGEAGGSYTDPRGPNASREMLRFFLAEGAAC
jgi:poly(hydroxyalkanoate) depolymerase family esterase